MTTQNFNAKSTLAKILAVEDIFVQHDTTEITASFDVKNRVLTLPVWEGISNDLFDMLVVHEVGHALDTPGDGWLKSIEEIATRVHGKKNKIAERSVKDFLNVVEDARIDKRQKRRFPGSRRNYIQGCKELYQRDFFGLSKVGDYNKLTFIDRANLFFKGGNSSLHIKFSDEEKVFIRKMERLETWEEVLELTEEIYRFAKNNGEQKNLPNFADVIVQIESEDGDESSQSGDSIRVEIDDELFAKACTNAMKDDNTETSASGAENQSDNGEKKKSDKSGSGSGSESNDSDDEDECGNKQNRVSQNGSDGSLCPGGDFVPLVYTETNVNKNLEKIVQKSAYDIKHVRVPEFKYDRIVEDFDVVLPRMEKALAAARSRRYRFDPYTVEQCEHEYEEWKNREKDSISFLVKEFETRKAAETYAKTYEAKTGVLDLAKLHTYKFNDDMFRRNRSVPKGKNHGFVMFLDWSGSMDVHIKETVKQLLTLTMFCKRLNIPFDVYFFRTAANTDFDKSATPDDYFNQTAPDTLSSQQMSTATTDIAFGPFKVCNILSSKMDHVTFNRACKVLWKASHFDASYDRMWGTPLNQTVLVASKIVRDFQKKNAVQIVNAIFLTDGASDYMNLKSNDYNPNSTERHNVWIITDPETRRTYNMSDPGRAYTGTFFEILKDRTECNIVGFYLHPNNKLDNCSYNLLDFNWRDYEAKDSAEKFWKKNGFYPSKSQGYDELFIINARNLSAVYDEELNVDSKMKKHTLTKNFIKFTGKKSVNRVLLKQFVDKIAARNKKKVA